MHSALRTTLLLTLLLARPLAAAAPGAPKGPPHPSGHQLVAKYEEVAGVRALRAVHTRACTGEVERTPSGTSASTAIKPFRGQLELYWKEPGRAREVWSDASDRLRRISDGKVGWRIGLHSKRQPLAVAERVELSRLGALYQPALVLPLEEATFEREARLGERAAMVLKVKSGELLWLDKETSLPLRVELLVERSEPQRKGEFYLSAVTFADWQQSGAVQLPRTVRRELAEATITYRLAEVKQDVELADSLFKTPYFWRK